MKPIAAACLLLSSLGVLTACSQQLPDYATPVRISGDIGSPPSIAVPSSKPPKGESAETISEGKGELIKKGDWVKFNVTSKVWGKKSSVSTYNKEGGAHPEVLHLGSQKEIPVFLTKIIGHRIGGRFLFTNPADKIFPNSQGRLPDGISVSDTIVTVVDVVSATQVPNRFNAGSSSGTSELRLGMIGTKSPVLSVSGDYKPSLKVDAHVLTKGSGKRLRKGDTVVANFAGFNLPDATRFQSTWGSASPFAFELGAHQVIAGWDQALDGSRVGDRLLVEVPPSLGYGKKPPVHSNIKPNSNTAFLIDILGAL
ncbi:FKBP-type peptidyl-prolyl cis-trans isomerase [Streptomyces sp. NPDC059688]|uniref:FKBP-type peptidyl-prolyl cis-trans isomerase n=1 Tax=Streptomyces sp. NPDC059688 TaxID=3346906 RepID=UPI0036D11C65